MDISLSETETDIARHIRTEAYTSSIYCGTETVDTQSYRHTQTKIIKLRHIQVRDRDRRKKTEINGDRQI